MILLLDNEDSLRMTMALNLQDAGFRTMDFADKLKGYEWALAHPPDLILSDLTSPGMDGFEFFARLRRDPVLSHIPVLFVTGLDVFSIREELLRQGAVGVIQKPFLFEELLNAVRRIVQGQPTSERRGGPDHSP